MNLFANIGFVDNRAIRHVLAAVAIFGIGVLGGTKISNRRIEKLEQRTADARAEADRRQAVAIEKESEAEQFKAKIAFMERLLAEKNETARKQDDEIKEISNVAGDLRNDVRRARGSRRIESTIEGLCKRLGELGHGCE